MYKKEKSFLIIIPLYAFKGLFVHLKSHFFSFYYPFVLLCASQLGYGGKMKPDVL